MDNKKIEILENNTIKEYDLLFTIKDNKNNRVYVIYTDLNSDIDIYAALYDENSKTIKYINDVKDQKMIEEIMNIIRKRMGD